MTLCRGKNLMANRFLIDDAKLMMPKSLVGSLVQSRAFENLQEK